MIISDRVPRAAIYVAGPLLAAEKQSPQLVYNYAILIEAEDISWAVMSSREDLMDQIATEARVTRYSFSSLAMLSPTQQLHKISDEHLSVHCNNTIFKVSTNI